uniref:Uncharacterized protein n=1 Tax=Candidozyma auris TaxID=498019 RepID=A0A0L0P472_CANAR
MVAKTRSQGAKSWLGLKRMRRNKLVRWANQRFLNKDRNLWQQTLDGSLFLFSILRQQ